MRKVTIYSTKTRAQQVIETAVATWGELKQLVNPEMGANDARCMVRENRTTLESNQAVLPTTDFTIFVYPEKVKSGGANKKEDAYASLSDAKLRKLAHMKSLSTTGDGISLRSRIRAYDKRHGLKAGETVAKSQRPTTLSKKKVVKAVKSPKAPKFVDESDEEEEIRESASSIHQEALLTENKAFNPRSEALIPNQDISIHNVVRVMKNKFLNMFDELEAEIMAGNNSMLNADILSDEADQLAMEAGFAISH